MPSRFRLPRIGSSVPGGRKQYKIKKKLGAGGNGAVYSVDAYNPDGSLLPEKYAIKVFVPKKNNDERFLRFKNEIDIILSCSSEIEGLISVLDYHLSSCHERVDYSWYMMPLAKPYELEKDIGQRIYDMIILGNTIRQLHFRGYDHRDIKPRNILLLKGKPILADFGLCWDESSDTHITGSSELLGPASIRPPEFEQHRDEGRIDYKKSDVYLFAKTVWIVLSKNWNGFRGEYNRKDSQIYLEKEIVGVKSLEPIHKMMEGATRYNCEDRINIEDCLRYLSIQKDIADETIDKNILNQYLCEETLGYANALDPDIRQFNSPAMVSLVLKRLMNFSFFVSLRDYERNVLLGDLRSVEEINDRNTYSIRLYDNRKMEYKSVIFQVSRLNLSKRNSVIETDQCDNTSENVKECFTVKDVLAPGHDTYLLRGKFTIVFDSRFDSV